LLSNTKYRRDFDFFARAKDGCGGAEGKDYDDDVVNRHTDARATTPGFVARTRNHGMLALEIHRLGVVPGVVVDVRDDDDAVAVSPVQSGFRNDTRFGDETEDAIHDAENGSDEGNEYDRRRRVSLVAVASAGENETETAARRGGVDVQV